jgi:putative alpha-1,2-mannosidase
MFRISILVTILLVSVIPGIARNNSRYVDPFIGTGAVEGGLSGNNYPGATAPFGMVQLSPDTHRAPDWYNASGYDYNDSIIYSFSHTRLSGTGASDFIDIGMFPTTGHADSSRFSHAQETASPGYYSVRLMDEDILAELAATTRVGIHRYTYPQEKERRLTLDLDHSANKGSWGRAIIQSQIRKTGPRTIEGFRVITGWAKLRKIYFVAEFSEDIRDMILSDGETVRNGATVINGKALKASLGFGTDNAPVKVKVALSGVSIANARKNMEAEAPHFDFDRYVMQGRDEWDKALGCIDAEGPEDKLKTFYTALYHLMIQPNTFSDVNGEYMTPAYTVAKVPDGSGQYSTFSLWDTYRAAHPLYSLLMPERNADFVNSMLHHYKVYGYLPVWHIWGQDNYCMIGNHAIPVVAEAVMNDTPGIDTELAYEAVRESSLQPHLNSPFDVWEKYDYMPETLQSQSVSITLEMAYDDWCVAQMARKLGKQEDYERFLKRSQYFGNLYDPTTGFFRAKDENGNWMEPFDPLKFGANGGYPYTEGNAWQYFWYVPHDIPALIALTGGNKAFEKKLDTFFSLTETSGAKNDNISGCIGQYAHGNEPSHHVAYLYNYVNAPHKAQRMVARIMNEMYDNTSSGYAGNDDCGEMSAWYVFGALGFYPVNPASGQFSIGTPLFDKCTIHLPYGHDLTITANRSNPDNVEVKSICLNGKKHKSLSLSRQDLVRGGSLHFEL